MNKQVASLLNADSIGVYNSEANRIFMARASEVLRVESKDFFNVANPSPDVVFRQVDPFKVTDPDSYRLFELTEGGLDKGTGRYFLTNAEDVDGFFWGIEF